MDGYGKSTNLVEDEEEAEAVDLEEKESALRVIEEASEYKSK